MAPIIALIAFIAVGVLAQTEKESYEVARQYHIPVSHMRVISGFNATLGQFPWQAYLECMQPNFISTACGGSLITKTHILTAAHCVLKASFCRVSLGIVSLSNRIIHYYVEPNNIKVHENFDNKDYLNDIAIIRLLNPVELEVNVQPIRLAHEFQNGFSLSGKQLLISGWGKTKDNQRGSCEHLQYAIVKGMPLRKCIDFFKNEYGVTLSNNQICTSYTPSNVCNGDSGGPLVLMDTDRRPTLVGITSLGLTPCSGGTPAIFTAVASYLKWIMKNL